MHGVPQIELGRELDEIGSERVHVLADIGLARPPMAAPVMRDHAIALVKEEQHLVVPVVGAQRPAVMEDDRLGVPRAPVLVEDGGSVGGGNVTHGVSPCSGREGWGPERLYHRPRPVAGIRLWYGWRRRYGQVMRPSDLDANARLSGTDLAALQLARLRESLRHAYEGNARYRASSTPSACTPTT